MLSLPLNSGAMKRHRESSTKTGIRNKESETESRKYTEYRIRERRFQATDLKKKLAMTMQINE